MKRYLLPYAVFLTGCLHLQAALPAFPNFDPRSLGTNGAQVKLADPITVDVTISNHTFTVKGPVGGTNWASDFTVGNFLRLPYVVPGLGAGNVAVYDADGTLTNAAVSGIISGANPTATIGLTPVNGSAGTYMRSDAAPALGSVGTPGTYGTATEFPVITTDAAGRVTAVTTNPVSAGQTNVAAANPTATIGLAAVNGTAPTFMRSDAAPALGSVGTPGTYGNSTTFPAITTDAAGRVTAVTTHSVTAAQTNVAAANPTASVGLSAVNGTAATFMRSDAAPPLSQSITPTWTGAHTHDAPVTFNQAVVHAIQTVAYAATTDIDIATSNPNYRVITLAGNLELTVSNKAAGRWFTVFLIGDGSSRTLTLPWTKYMNQAEPTTLAANKTASLTVFYVDGTDANAIVNYAVQP